MDLTRWNDDGWLRKELLFRDIRGLDSNKESMRGTVNYQETTNFI